MVRYAILAQLHVALLVVIACAVTVAADNERIKHRQTKKERKLAGEYFNLRMYWKQGYRWQESTSEKFWCMKCRNSGCTVKSGIKIAKCDKDDWRQHFFFDDGRVRSRRNKAVCLERSGRTILLNNCKSSTDQVWDTLNKQIPFQLTPPGDDEKCATQHHEPRADEIIYMAACKLAISTDTDKWIVY